ncbi:MAG: hypothetical protein ACHQYP_05315 [Nitrospiria bacterium]
MIQQFTILERSAGIIVLYFNLLRNGYTEYTPTGAGLIDKFKNMQQKRMIDTASFMKKKTKIYLNLFFIFIIFLSIFFSFAFPIAIIHGQNIALTLLSSIVCFLIGIECFFNLEKHRELVFDTANRSKSRLLILWAKSFDPKYEVMYQVAGGIVILISFYLFGVFVSDLFLYLS